MKWISALFAAMLFAVPAHAVGPAFAAGQVHHNHGRPLSLRAVAPPLAPGTYGLTGGTYQFIVPTPVSSPTTVPTATPTLQPPPTATPAPTPSAVPTAAPSPSPDKTVVMGTAGAIVDATGHAWTITSAALVAVNGVPDTTTAGVLELAYVGGTVWQENNAALWWGKTSPTAAWLPNAGTAVSPLGPGPTASATPTSVPTPKPTAGPTQIPTPAPTQAAGFAPMLPVSATIASLTGDPSALKAAVPSVNTDPSTFGTYDDRGGLGPSGVHICCGPLLTDRAAASTVVVEPKSKVELTGSQDGMNNYYQSIALTNPSGYLAALAAFHAEFSSGTYGISKVVADRIDGACPIQNPTTAELNSCFAHKWGFSDRYGKTELCDEGDYDNNSLGDVCNGIGTSSGLTQCADRNTASCQNHAWPGFSNATDQNLSRESAGFNLDFFYATRYASLIGQSGGETPANNLPRTVQDWFENGTPSAYEAMIFSDMISGWQNAGIKGGPPCWVVGFYNGQTLPIDSPAGTVPHE